MGEDLATLGLRVEAGRFISDVKAAKTETVALGTASTKTEQQFKALDQQTQTVARSMGQVAQVEQQRARTMEAAAARRAAFTRTNAVQMLSLAQAEERAAATATALAASSNAATAGANRLRGGLATLAGQATGLNPALVQVTSTVAMLGAGSVVVSGVLLGVAAIGKAYQELTEDTRAATKALDESTEALARAARARMLGPGGEAASQGGIQSERVAELRRLIELEQRAATFYGGGDAEAEAMMRSSAERRLKVLREELATREGLVRESSAQVSEIERQASIDREEQVRRGLDVAERLARETAASAEKMREAARAAQDYARELARLNAEAERAAGAIPSATLMLSGALGVGPRDMSGPGPQGTRNAAGYVINYRPDLKPISKPTGVQSGGTNWGKYAEAGAAVGGIVVGTGLAGKGYAAAGLGGALSGVGAGAGAGAAVGMAFGGPPGAIVGAGVGAIVGAVGGLVSGLLGHSKKIKEEAKAIAAAQKVFDANLKTRQAEVAGDTARAQQLRLAAQHERELAEARAAGMSKASIATLQSLQYEEKLALVRDQAAAQAEVLAEKERQLSEQREQALQRSEDMLVRMFSALGMGADAQRAGLQFQHRREMAGVDPADREMLTVLHQIEARSLEVQLAIQAVVDHAQRQIDAIDAQIQVEMDALRIAEEQLRTQQQTVDSLRRVVESLASFGDSMKLGNLSPLAPKDQLAEARKQVEMLENLARGGDATAAASLPAAIRQLLEYSAKFYGTATPEYQKEFTDAQKLVEDIRKQFANQLTVEEKVLAELEKQTDQHRRQIKELEAQKSAIEKAARDQISSINAAWELEKLQWTNAIQKLADQVGYLLKIQHSTDATKQLQGQLATEAAKVQALQDAYKEVNKYWTDQMAKVQAAHAAALTTLVAEINKLMFPGRALGGPVTGGSPYIVGERGPEVFVPSASGRIIPNGATVSGSDSAHLGAVLDRLDGVLSKIESGPHIMASGFEEVAGVTREVALSVDAMRRDVVNAMDSAGSRGWNPEGYR